MIRLESKMVLTLTQSVQMQVETFKITGMLEIKVLCHFYLFCLVLKGTRLFGNFKVQP